MFLICLLQQNCNRYAYVYVVDEANATTTDKYTSGFHFRCRATSAVVALASLTT